MPMRNPSAARLRALLRSFPKARVVVVGDVIVDHYIWGQVQRISPEAPVPVVDVRRESRRPGGAANVAHNIRTLGGQTELVGMVGPDEAGLWLTAELGAKGIGIEGLIQVEDRPTTMKTRVIAHSQQVVRVDRERREHLPPRIQAAVKEYMEHALRRGATVVVSDYGKGVLSPALLQFLRELAERRGLNVLVDPKSRHFAVYKGFTMVTPNQREAEAAAGVEITDETSLRKVGFKLLEILESKALLITRGEAGMSLFTPGRVTHIPTTAREVYDVTGAGDTVLATLALALSSGASFHEAALLSNLAAGVAVAEVGTSAVTRPQILGVLRQLPEFAHG